MMYAQLADIDTLYKAWTVIRDKDSAGGIDKVSCEYYGENLKNNLLQLTTELSTENYLPQPYLEVKIPKDGHEVRALSLPAVSDKIVQQAVRELIEPLLEKEFLDVSYGYRVGKGPLKAIGRVKHLIFYQGLKWLVSCDIDNFFDTIPHGHLINLFRLKIKDEKICRLVETWINMYLNEFGHFIVFKKLAKIMDQKTDSILYYYLCKDCLEKAEQWGGREEKAETVKVV